MAPRYSRSPIADEGAYQKKLEITQSYLRPEMNVLEFGCGTGSTALVHASFVGHITAIDYSSKMIDIAKAKAEEANITNVEFKHATLEDLNFPTQTFDVVLGLNILHLLDTRTAAISRAYELLKPGGIFISSTAVLGDSLSFLKFLLPIGHTLRLLPYVGVFKSDQLTSDLNEAGFEIDREWLPSKGQAVFIVATKPR